MHARTTLGASLILSGCILGGCERPAPQPPVARAPTATTPTPPAGTASGTTTAMDQSNSSADIQVTAAIRRAIMEDSAMSVAAQNCTIVTDSAGTVTLKGAVDSQAEKNSIEAKAKAAAGDRRVVSQLSVKQP